MTTVARATATVARATTIAARPTTTAARPTLTVARVTLTIARATTTVTRPTTTVARATMTVAAANGTWVTLFSIKNRGARAIPCYRYALRMRPVTGSLFAPTHGGVAMHHSGNGLDDLLARE